MTRLNKYTRAIVIFGSALLCLEVAGCKTQRKNVSTLDVIRRISLPQPVLRGSTSVEEALSARRSRRDYTSSALQLKDVSQLLWAAQGITGDGGKRTAPSAGSTYPIEVYLVSINVDSLVPGVYHYAPAGHLLEQIAEEKKQAQLSLAALMQGSVGRAAAIIVIMADYERTMHKYAARGERFVHLEAGHVAQNICLEAVSLNIGVVTVGAFKDSLVKQYIGSPSREEPLYLIPAGKI